MNKEGNTYRYFLNDLGDRLVEGYQDAESKYAHSPPGTPDHEFNAGRRLAYYEVITAIRSLVIAFELPLSIVRMEDLDPDQGHR